MARMHCSKRGKASSRAPYRLDNPEWVRISSDEIESKIIEFADQGHTSSVIGMMLRDGYGVPNAKKVIGKSITTVMRDNDKLPSLPEDLRSLIRQSLRLNKHLEDNKKDFSTKRALQLTNSKIHRLARYYRKTGKVESTFRFRQKDVALYLK